MIDLIKPDWPAPTHIHAYTTTRTGGYSEAPFDSFNLATHVDDNKDDVLTNRALLQEVLALTQPPCWLNQVHGNKIINIDGYNESFTADAAFSRMPTKICTVMTADCLPILITDNKGTVVAAIHAGWRSILSGVIENSIRCLRNFTDDFLVWFGPAIGPDVFEVGPEVREQFLKNNDIHELAFRAGLGDRYLANIYQLARNCLETMGVSQIYGGDFCTFTDYKRFYSYRRDNKTGRMASMIWISPTIE